MALESGPQVLDWVHVGRVRWPEYDLNVPNQAVRNHFDVEMPIQLHVGGLCAHEVPIPTLYGN